MDLNSFEIRFQFEFDAAAPHCAIRAYPSAAPSPCFGANHVPPVSTTAGLLSVAHRLAVGPGPSPTSSLCGVASDYPLPLLHTTDAPIKRGRLEPSPLFTVSLLHVKTPHPLALNTSTSLPSTSYPPSVTEEPSSASDLELPPLTGNRRRRWRRHRWFHAIRVSPVVPPVARRHLGCLIVLTDKTLPSVGHRSTAGKRATVSSRVALVSQAAFLGWAGATVPGHWLKPAHHCAPSFRFLISFKIFKKIYKLLKYVENIIRFKKYKINFYRIFVSRS
jgi:hypothetical protein